MLHDTCHECVGGDVVPVARTVELIGTATIMNDPYSGNEVLQVLRTKAEKGDTLAQYELATVLATGIWGEQRPEDAFYWYMKAALGGHAEAMWNAGLQLVEGEGAEQDVEAGLHLIHLAANARCYAARCFLEKAYQLGLHGMPQDQKRSEFWRCLANEK